MSVFDKAAFKFESSDYGDPAVCGSGDKLHFMFSSGIPIQGYRKAPRIGSFDSNPMVAVNSFVDVRLTTKFTYSETALIFAILGMSARMSSPINVAGSIYRHFAEPDNIITRPANMFEANGTSDMATRRGTLCMDIEGSIHQIDGVFFESLLLTSNPIRTELTLSGKGRHILFDTSDNSASSGWSHPGESLVKFSGLEIWLKARDEFTIAGGNNAVSVDEGGGAVTVTITNGTYSGPALAKEFETKLNASPLTGTYSTQYDFNTRKFKTTGTVAFDIDKAGGDDLDETMGYTDNDTIAKFQISATQARPNKFSAFVDGDKISVSQIDLNISTDSVRLPEKNHHPFLGETFRKNMIIEGSIQIPTLPNNDFLTAVTEGEVYGMKVKFTGDEITSPHNEEVIFHLPQVVLSTNQAPVDATAVKQTIKFQVIKPIAFPDLSNFAIEDYYCRQINVDGDDVKAVASFLGKLYAFEENPIEIHRLDGNSWTDLGESFAGTNVYSLQTYKNELYFGGDQGVYKKYDGSTFAAVTNNLDESRDMEVHDGNLYSISDEAGIERFNGSTWTTEIADNSGDVGFRLKRFNDKLYAVREIGGDGKVYERSTAGSWSESFDFGASATAMALEVHGGYLYALMDSNFARYDGSSWETLSSFGEDQKELLSFRGLLFIFNNADISVYDLNTDTIIEIDNGISGNLTGKPIVFDDKVLQPTDSGIYVYVPPKTIICEMKNTVSKNKIFP